MPTTLRDSQWPWALVPYCLVEASSGGFRSAVEAEHRFLREIRVKGFVADVVADGLAVRAVVVVIIVSTMALVQPLDVRGRDMVLFLIRAIRSGHQLPLRGGHGRTRHGAGEGVAGRGDIHRRQK